MKIIAVGMNYVAHCHELHADENLPEEPVIFMKPDSALLKDSKPFFIPDFSQQVDYETELVVRINRLGKNIAPRFASRYYDAVTVGIDFTARDLQRQFREEGKPWELCKGFDSSAAIGDFVPVDRFKDIQNLNFHLDIDGKTVQRGNLSKVNRLNAPATIHPQRKPHSRAPHGLVPDNQCVFRHPGQEEHLYLVVATPPGRWHRWQNNRGSP